MIWYDRDGERWTVTCGGCLDVLPDVAGTRDEVIAAITGAPHWWEWQSIGDMCRCLKCAKEARDVPFPLKRRGQRSKRR